ncbi:MAG: hypothetical protein CMO61_03305 [Verrucomicrobiales bacterium]|nr:hypothetical protein [Verrucomicrobiales bacterium]|tara:strand:- start:24692 stop:25891 length:1200 start_codon:yes stop_codon:yes gene_type:complete
MTQLNSLKKLASGTAIAALAAGAFASDHSKTVIDDKMPLEDPWTICDLFDYSTLYESDAGFIREISLTGRYHGQWISASQDDDGDREGFHQFQSRRSRVGFEIGILDNITFATEFNVTDSSGSSREWQTGRFFNDIDTMLIEIEGDGWDLWIGKNKFKVTREESTSSKRIKTIERSQIVNEVLPGKPWGFNFAFQSGDVAHVIGAGLTGSDLDSSGQGWAFPTTEGSNAQLLYRLETPVTDVTTFYLDYLFTNTGNDSDNDIASSYNHVLALGTTNALNDRLNVTTDLIFGFDRESSGAIPDGENTWGLVILPTYSITEKLEFVAKYAYMDSGRTQRPQRYTDREELENCHTLYAGLNYYICSDKLKLMAGYEYMTADQYASTDDITSDTWMLAVRTYF